MTRTTTHTYGNDDHEPLEHDRMDAYAHIGKTARNPPREGNTITVNGTVREIKAAEQDVRPTRESYVLVFEDHTVLKIRVEMPIPGSNSFQITYELHANSVEGGEIVKEGEIPLKTLGFPESTNAPEFEINAYPDGQEPVENEDQQTLTAFA